MRTGRPALDFALRRCHVVRRNGFAQCLNRRFLFTMLAARLQPWSLGPHCLGANCDLASVESQLFLEVAVASVLNLLYVLA